MNIEMAEEEYADILTDDEVTYYVIDRFFQHDRTITEKLLYSQPKEVAIHAKARLPQMVGHLINRLFRSDSVPRNSA